MCANARLPDLRHFYTYGALALRKYGEKLPQNPSFVRGTIIYEK